MQRWEFAEADAGWAMLRRFERRERRERRERYGEATASAKAGSAAGAQTLPEHELLNLA